jgi:adenosine deaminase
MSTFTNIIQTNRFGKIILMMIKFIRLVPICKTILYLLTLELLIASCNSRLRNEQLTEKYFNSIRREGDNAALTLFLTQMPKGGDIHHHYSGALYFETYLDWAAKENLFLDTRNFMLTSDTAEQNITIDSLKRNEALYRVVSEEWSDEDFSDNFHLQNPPDQHFFNTFNFFGGISKACYREGLAEIKQEAEKENVQYIETMFSIPGFKVKFRENLKDSLKYYEAKKDTQHLYQIFNLLVQSIKSAPSYDKSITDYIDSIHSYHAGIDDSNFSMRFQAYAARTAAPASVFAMLYGSFDAVTRDKSSLLVGVNIVAPENNIVSMRDYWLHMQMFRYLKDLFPTVKTAMHAGEVAMGMVKPQDLTYHIYDAVFIAKANRIGHGVDIPYETQAFETLKKMKSDSIAIEINLSSNEFILGVKGNDHPINLYYTAGVPVVISTDDAGVSRNNLSYEYVLLASRYHFSYKQIKTFVFNSIKYSFLKENEKLDIEKKLNQRFEFFEAKIASFSMNTK